METIDIIRAVYISLAAGILLPIVILVLNAFLFGCCSRRRQRRSSLPHDVEKGDPNGSPCNNNNGKSSVALSSPILGRISYALGVLNGTDIKELDNKTSESDTSSGSTSPVNSSSPNTNSIQTPTGPLRNSTGTIHQDSLTRNTGYRKTTDFYMKKTHRRNHSIGGYSEMMAAIGVHIDPKVRNKETEKVSAESKQEVMQSLIVGACRFLGSHCSLHGRSKG